MRQNLGDHKKSKGPRMLPWETKHSWLSSVYLSYYSIARLY